MIPARPLVLLFIVPLGLALATLADRSLVWPMIAADLGIVLLAALDALLARRALVSVERAAPAVLSLQRPGVVTLELRSTSRRKLRVEVHEDLFDAGESDELPLVAEVPARGHVTARYKLTATRRGAHTLGDHHVRYRSPLGLWTRQLNLRASTIIKVYPDVEAVRAYELQARKDRDPTGSRSTRQRGGESEFARLRDYRRGDEYRAIDWKATARRQKLTAREYQLESNQTVLFLLDAGRLMTAEAGGRSLFDCSLDAAVMLSHVAARGGDRVGMLSFADEIKGYAPPTAGQGAARRVVQAGYDLYPELVETSYARAFGEVGVRVRKRSLLVLFTQVVDEVSAAELVRHARGALPRHLPLVVLLRDEDLDGLVEGKGTSPFVRGAAAELSSNREHLIRDLERHGVLVLDAKPKDLTPSLVNRYLEIKARHLL